MFKEVSSIINLNHGRNLTANEYFKGRKIYGDDFTIDEIKKWYEDEKEGYLSLISDQEYTYNYHALNRFYGFRYLKMHLYENVLGLGSAFGDEFKLYLN